MTLTDEKPSDTIYQATKHAMLIPWGRLSRHLKLNERLRAAVTLPRHLDAIPGGDLILKFGLASLAGYEYLQDLNLGSHPLAKDQAVQDAWDVRFGHYTTVSGPQGQNRPEATLERGATGLSFGSKSSARSAWAISGRPSDPSWPNWRRTTKASRCVPIPN